MFWENIKKVCSETIKSMDSHIYDSASAGFFRESRVKEKMNILKQQSLTYRQLVQQLHEKKYRLADSVFLGGDLLSDMLTNGDLSSDVLASYELAYPRLAEAKTFQEAIESMDDKELGGFVSGVKGKLFEVKYTDFLNDSGELPDGYIASFADSPTQKGWDIMISGPDSEIVDHIQAKATDSLGYVQEALDKYPDIDVVTTDEVFSHLTMTDAAERIIDSNISNADLTEAVSEGIDSSSIKMDLTLPVLSFAMIAFTSFSKQDCDIYQKCSHFGKRAGKSYVCFLLSKSAAVMTQSWLIGLAVSFSSRFLAAKGKKNRAMFFELRRLIDTNETVIKRLENKLS